IAPCAPALLSTTNGCLSASCSCWPSTRATWSVALPAGNGTTSFTGRDGYGCATAAALASRARAASSVLLTGSSSGIEPGDELARLRRIGRTQHLLRERLRLRQVGAQHALLDRRQLRRVHRDVAQPEAEQQSREGEVARHLAAHRH